jgi:hypothetical protein
MHPLEELSYWSIAAIREGLPRLLPEGWVFEESPSEGLWGAKIYSPDKVEWQERSFDERLLLLGAYGFLWMLGYKSNEDSPWFRPNTQTREDSLAKINSVQFVPVFNTAKVVPMSRPNVPDPPDLDPSEVFSVYGLVSQDCGLKDNLNGDK